MVKRVVVIGGGPAGIEAATTVAREGGHAILISDGSLYSGTFREATLPSKAWMLAASHPRRRGSVLDNFHTIQDAWSGASTDRLQSLGIQIVQGRASFTAHRLVTVSSGNQETVIEGDAFIIAVGGKPIVLPGLEPDGVSVFSPHLVHQLKDLPRSMIVVGDGPEGIEYVDYFSRLGVRVTWLLAGQGVLPFLPASVGEFLSTLLRAHEVQMEFGQFAQSLSKHSGEISITSSSGKTFQAEMAFVAIGSRPDLTDLNVEVAGLTLNERRVIDVDDYCQSRSPQIYAVGDAVRRGSASWARSQARVAALHILNKNTPPYDAAGLVIGFYTEPPVAWVGALDWNQEGVSSAHIDFGECFAPWLHGDGAGFLEFAYDNGGYVVGAVAVGGSAGDVLVPFSLAIRCKLKVSELANTYGPYLTFSELPFDAARSAVQSRSSS